MGVYMTAWVAGTPTLRNKVISLFDTKAVNAVVIDIKDATGRVAYEPLDPQLKALGISDHRIKDLPVLIAELHKRGIYVIGRVASFQDPFMVKLHPDWAVKRANGVDNWKDHKGISWIDVSAKPMWDYLAAIGKDAYAQGFDEINYDYVRFPSDGNMQDISFPWTEKQPAGSRTKPEALKTFFVFLWHTFTGNQTDPGVRSAQYFALSQAAASTTLDSASSTPGEIASSSLAALPPVPQISESALVRPIISVDLFGLTTTAQNDLGIGQVLANALPYVDYVCPMVYPSHFGAGWNGYPNPDAVPYQVISESMESAAEVADTHGISPDKLRPWLQDFSLGVIYTPALVEDQIRAADELGLSWLMWNASNHYTAAALPNKPGPSVASAAR